MDVPRVVALSLQLQRPYHAALDCWKGIQGRTQALIPDKARSVANSILGNFVICYGAETAGEVVGTPVGRTLGRWAVVNLDVVLVLSVVGISLGMALSRPGFSSRAFQLGFAIATVAIPAFAIRAYTDDGGRSFGEWVGKTIGAIFGMYAGLLLVNCRGVRFYDALNPTRCYSVGMAKYQFMGDVFDAVIVRPQSRFFSFCRNGIRALTQSVAYNSHSVIPCIRHCVKKKQVSKALIPFTVQLLCSRYYDAHAVDMAKSLVSALPSGQRFPGLLQKSLSFVNRSLLMPAVQSSLQKLMQNTDMLMAAAMRGLHQYVSLVGTLKMPEGQVNERVLEQTLATAIPGVSALPVEGQHLSEWSDGILQILQDGGQAVVGLPLLSPHRSQVMKRYVKIHLKYYLVYLITHSPQLLKQPELSLIEERDFLLDLSNNICRVYTYGSSWEGAHPYLAAVPRGLTRCFYSTKERLSRFVVDAKEQETLLVNALAIDESYVRQPSPKPDAFLNDFVEVGHGDARGHEKAT